MMMNRRFLFLALLLPATIHGGNWFGESTDDEVVDVLVSPIV